MINVFFCIGLVITFFISSFVTWRLLAWILLTPMAMTILGMMIIPETPLWLAQKGRLKDGLVALSWLRSNQETDEEVRELKDKYDNETNSSVWTKMKTKLHIAQSWSFWKPFLLAEPLNILYSCSGTSIITFYIVTVFQESGTSVDKVLVLQLFIFNNPSPKAPGISDSSILETMHVLVLFICPHEATKTTSVSVHCFINFHLHVCPWPLLLFPILWIVSRTYSPNPMDSFGSCPTYICRDSAGIWPNYKSRNHHY